MSLDYTFDSLQSMQRQELEELAARMIQRLVPEDAMKELFTFEQEEVETEERLQAAQFDALLRMTAIALSELQLAFSESDNPQQNIERMTRLILWHFYAISFHLENAITLKVHCDKVEELLKQAPKDAFAWVKSLTDLLHHYAKLNEQQS